MNQLDGIKQFTTVVADSGDIESIRPLSASGRHHQSLAAAKSGWPCAIQPFD
ncbi:transaldolase A [Citrobacter koseri]|uniref:Transaldolase A n=1 Tax=Citrobacter koseri TaxID=545 RepID=A0A2X2VBY0_CITKO|nr:transaldolase A [Citrobacter koseri]